MLSEYNNLENVTFKNKAIILQGESLSGKQSLINRLFKIEENAWNKSCTGSSASWPKNIFNDGDHPVKPEVLLRIWVAHQE